MLKFKALFERVLRSQSDEFIISFITTDVRVAEALSSLDTTQLQTVEVKKFFDKRSLNANAYFHVLCDKIAEKMQLGIDAVKQMLVWDFGTQLTDEDGNRVFIRLPSSVNATAIYKYAKYYQDSPNTPKPCCDYIIYKETHTLDKKEMARLIEGTIQTATDLEIETRTPNEIAEMMSLYEEGTSELRTG